jgi:hypothetical protein
MTDDLPSFDKLFPAPSSWDALKQIQDEMVEIATSFLESEATKPDFGSVIVDHALTDLAEHMAGLQGELLSLPEADRATFCKHFVLILRAVRDIAGIGTTSAGEIIRIKAEWAVEDARKLKNDQWLATARERKSEKNKSRDVMIEEAVDLVARAGKPAARVLEKLQTQLANAKKTSIGRSAFYKRMQLRKSSS